MTEIERAIKYIIDNPLDRSIYRLNREHCIKDIENGEDFFFCKECGALEYAHYYHYEDTLKANQLCFFCNFWHEKIPSLTQKRVFIIDNHYYSDAGNSPNALNKSHLGHSGREFRIKKGGEIIETNNLWSAGDIPEHLQKHFPNNATFEKTY